MATITYSSFKVGQKLRSSRIDSSEVLGVDFIVHLVKSCSMATRTIKRSQDHIQKVLLWEQRVREVYIRENFSSAEPSKSERAFDKRTLQYFRTRSQSLHYPQSQLGQHLNIQFLLRNHLSSTLTPQTQTALRSQNSPLPFELNISTKARFFIFTSAFNFFPSITNPSPTPLITTPFPPAKAPPQSPPASRTNGSHHPNPHKYLP